MTSELPADPYKWWVDRRVDVFNEDRQWEHGQVIEARRAVLFGTSAGGDEPFYYEAQLGEADGDMHVIILEGKRRNEILTFEIFPGAPFGIVPRVVPHLESDGQLAIWWRELSPAARAALLEDPDGYVDPSVLNEVVQKGASLTAAYWPECQAGPDGFMLSERYRRLVVGIRLRRAYVRAEEALAAAFRKGQNTSGQLPALSDVFYRPGVRELGTARDQAKVELDLHCL